MDNDDPLFNNKYISNITENAGYGMTDEIKRFRLREHVEKQKINLESVDPEQEDFLLDSDMLKTNPVMTEDGEAKKLDVNRHVKERITILNINSIQRQEIDRTTVLERNEGTGLYTRNVFDDDGNMTVQFYNVDILNNEFEPGPTDIHRPYFLRPDGDIGKSTYKFRDPNNYELTLPKIFTNVKSIRLLSVEIPNTLNVINHYNNIIMLTIRDNDTGESVIMKDTSFDFFLYQLTPGSYNMTQLANHIQERTNDFVTDHTFEGFINLFTVTIDEVTGEVIIKINNPPGRDLEFHWRFWFAHELDGSIPITKFSNLWYLLGFPQPYETNNDGTDKYTTKLTNLFDFGLNELLEDKVPDETTYHEIKPYKYPDIFPHKYIYLEIQGLQAITDIQNPDVSNFKSGDIFAKIIYDV